MLPEFLQYTSTVSHMTATHFPVHSTSPAYLDPGTGSLIIQVAIGFLVGGLLGVKTFWKRISGFFRGLSFWSSRGGKPRD